MEISHLHTRLCSCGRKHKLPIVEIEIASGILSGLDQKLAALGAWENILLVADENTWSVAGTLVEKALAGKYSVSKVIFSGQKLKPNEESVERILACTTTPDLLLAVGSGTITDLVRYCAANKWDIPFVSIPTAPSMDGYASTVSAMTFSGFKVTKPARPPLAIYGDLAVLKAAPARLLAAGAADLLGKYTALSDWILARELIGEYYCPDIADLVRRVTDDCARDPVSLRERRDAAVANLTEGLILSGIGILMVGNSRPASGSEHHLSHFWEMKEQLQGEGEHLHGEKVAVGSLLAARAYQFLLGQDLEKLSYHSRWRTLGLSWEEYSRELEKTYGPLVEELPIMKAEPPKAEPLPAEFSEKLANGLSQIRVRPPALQTIEESLYQVGAPVGYQDLELPKAWVREALLYGREVRERYTIFTLLAQLGLLSKAADEILESC